MNLLFNTDKKSSQLIHEILEHARRLRREDFVARALISAHLSVQYPRLETQTSSAGTASTESDDRAELFVNDTVFHVTTAPSPYLYEKWAENLQNGYRVFILVPERLLTDVRQYVASVLPGKVTVTSVETFLSQSIEYSAAFSKDEIIRGVWRLLNMYNQQVAALTRDTALLIELPHNRQ